MSDQCFLSYLTNFDFDSNGSALYVDHYTNMSTLAQHQNFMELNKTIYSKDW